MPVPSNWSQNLREFVRGWDSNKEEYQGYNPFPKFVLTEQAESWDAFLQWVNELQGSWCFRGQREADWLLHTSLDRKVRVEYSGVDPSTGFHSSGYYHLPREIEERELLFRFQQQAHRYISQLPSDQDLSSWLALMQHHGVPTRFLDWTKSPYAAMYFAFEEKPQEKCSAVWAIDLDWLENKAHQLLQSEALTPVPGDAKATEEYLNGLLRQTGKWVIVEINPTRIDERMAAQQGLFLCVLHNELFFIYALMSMMAHPKTPDGHLTAPDQPVVRKLEVKSDLRIEFLRNLRAMNIQRSSLFPGLDGFGQSLRLDLEIKVAEEAQKASSFQP